MNEIILDLPFHDYLALDRYGSSDLRNMRLGPPALVPWKKANHEDTEATILGTAAHCAILAPELYEDAYAFKPEGMTFASKEGKAWRDAHEGSKILTFDQTNAVHAIRLAFYEKIGARESLAAAEAVEASVLWECGVSKLRCKGRPDWFDSEAVLDLKISRHAMNAVSIPFRAFADGWMHQLAHNRAGLRAAGKNVNRGRLVVISPKAPCAINIHLLEVKEDALDILELENERTRSAIAECDKSGVWPGTPETWRMIEPPASALIETLGILDGVEIVDE